MAEERVQRKLAAILSADVVGYSRLMGEDEEETHRTLTIYRGIIDRLIARHEGRIFTTAGDSLMADFGSAVEAVRCAVSIQEEVKVRNAELADDRKMMFRIGIHVGDVIVEGDNLFGDGVNVAARLEGIAEPSGICVSGSAFDQVKNKLSIGFENIGPQEVKNIAEPVPAFRVVAGPVSVATRAETRSAMKRWQMPALAAAVVVIVVVAGVAWWQPWAPTPEAVPTKASAFRQIPRPTRHFRVERPADLADADALTIYDRILEDMVAGYRKSENAHAAAYHGWRRYNATPYLSATHGKRYLNNYANDTAKAYGNFEGAGTLPVGSVLAKDSFEVTDRGDVLTGPLSVMEKMPPGFNPEGRNWRYTMILADGTLFGTTNGEGSERVEFCMDCHIAAGDARDHLFFVPARRRVRFLN